MNKTAIDERSQKAAELRVFQVNDGRYFVESSGGKICYSVFSDNGIKSCTCGDYNSNIGHNPGFVCKHIMAVVSANGNAKPIHFLSPTKPKLDDRFIIKIRKKNKEKEFVLYSGLLDLAHQIGIKRMYVEALQYPTKDNAMEGICRATVETLHGNIYTELGDANPKNVTELVAGHILRMAATRAKARALRDMTNIGMTCLEELGGDLDDVMGDESQKPAQKAFKPEVAQKPIQEATKPNVTQESVKPETAKPEQPAVSQNTAKPESASETPKPAKATVSSIGTDKPKLSMAQKNAIFNLAQRRGLSQEELEAMSNEMFNSTLETLSAQDASSFIRNLQQAA
jgi:hypothetical protein